MVMEDTEITILTELFLISILLQFLSKIYSSVIYVTCVTAVC